MKTAKLFSLALTGALLLPAGASGQARTTSGSSPPPASGLDRDHLLDQARDDASNGKYDQAVGEITLALQMNDKDAGAYEQRAELYSTMKLWDKAARDYTAANKISPDPAYKYKLGEIQYVQKRYDEARPYFTGIQSDSRLGELARYRVFLCDLFGAHESIAAGDLAVIDRNPKSVGYYYANVAYHLYHGERLEANKLLAQVDQAFDKDVRAPYILAVIEAQNFLGDLATFKSKDGRQFVQSRVFVEGNRLRVLTKDGWIALSLDQLPDDLSDFPSMVQEQLTRLRQHASVIAPSTSLITFTTKAGKTYDNVRWSVEDEGLSVLTPDGWTVVPFSQLPDTYSSFPKDLQDALQQRRSSSPASAVESISFITRDGRRFDDVRARLGDDGLSVLTADGWTTVPFSQLPEDRSCFPKELRDALQQRPYLAATDSTLNVSTVSFTTRNGRRYDDARARLDDDGLSVLGTDGWVTIPFSDLPADLSPFPAGWRDQLRAAASVPDTSDRPGVISFTTKSGKHYDDVRAALEDDGLRLTTPDGLTHVPWKDVPDDLSVFPSGWRTKIAAAKKAAVAPTTAISP